MAYLHAGRTCTGMGGQLPATVVRKSSQEGDDETDSPPVKSLRDGFSMFIPQKLQRAARHGGGNQSGHTGYVPAHDCHIEGCQRVIINVSCY